MNDSMRKLLALHLTVLIIGSMTVVGVFTASESGLAIHTAGNVSTVEIDIKPGSDVNPINPKKRGVTPVAVLHTETFDPSTVAVSTVRFGAPDTVHAGDGAMPAHDGHREDVDGDGDLDLVLHFSTQAAEFESNDTQGLLVGNTTDGTRFVGNDSIRIVGPSAGKPPGASSHRGGR